LSILPAGRGGGICFGVTGNVGAFLNVGEGGGAGVDAHRKRAVEVVP
jgi:hypothetical protein